MSFTLVIVSGLTLLLFIIWDLGKNRRPSGLPPGPRPLPILGNLHQIGFEPYKSFVELGKKYGKIFSVDFGSYRAVVVNDLKLLKQCLSNPAFTGRPKFRAFQLRYGPNARNMQGLILSESEHWVSYRRFVLKNLRDFGLGKFSMEGIIHEEIQELTERLRKSVGKPISTRGLFNIAVVNSLWRICTGVRMAQDDPKLEKLVSNILDAFSASTPLVYYFPILTKLFPNLTGFNTLLHGMKEVEIFVTHEYDVHKSSLVPGNPRDLLDSMIEEVESTNDPNSAFYSDEGRAGVIKSLEDLFFAGMETTSTTLSWICLIMAMFPEIQDKLFLEINRVVGPSRLPNLSDRSNMPFTECVFMEVLRFVSLLPLSVVHTTTEDVQVEGYTIPKDTVFTPNLYAVLHDRGIWGDPENFRPERFLLDDGTVNKSHEAFIPFSYGKRICIGEKLARDEVFLFTASLFQRFRVMLKPHSAVPSLKAKATLVLSPNPHELILLERL